MRLPPEVNRIIFVRNLPHKITAEELFDIFGKYGALRQIRRYEFSLLTLFDRGNTTKTKGTAFVVYEDIYDAKNAVDHLNGFNVAGKYLICLYYQAHKQAQKSGTAQENTKVKQELNYLKEKYNL